jgi:hypothetical protein
LRDCLFLWNRRSRSYDRKRELAPTRDESTALCRSDVPVAIHMMQERRPRRDPHDVGATSPSRFVFRRGELAPTGAVEPPIR